MVILAGSLPEKTNINHLEFLISDTDFTKTAKITILLQSSPLRRDFADEKPNPDGT